MAIKQLVVRLNRIGSPGAEPIVRKLFGPEKRGWPIGMFEWSVVGSNISGESRSSWAKRETFVTTAGRMARREGKEVIEIPWQATSDLRTAHERLAAIARRHGIE